MSRNIKTIAYIGLLTAATVVLARFIPLINVATIRISLSFLPIVLGAIVLGPWQAGAVAALSDVIGALLVPTGGYFPGFTITIAIAGIELGLFLSERQEGKIRKICFTITAVAIHQIILSLFIDTIWLKILTGSNYWGLLVSRIPECAIHFTVETAIIIAFADSFRKLRPILFNNYN